MEGSFSFCVPDFMYIWKRNVHVSQYPDQFKKMLNIRSDISRSFQHVNITVPCP